MDYETASKLKKDDIVFFDDYQGKVIKVKKDAKARTAKITFTDGFDEFEVPHDKLALAPASSSFHSPDEGAEDEPQAAASDIPEAIEGAFSDTKAVEKAVMAQLSRYGGALRDMERSFKGNFLNCYRELFNVFAHMDSELYPDAVPRVYTDGPKGKDELASVDDIAWNDRNDEMTPFGVLLVRLRFYAGWIGNIAQGDELDLETVATIAALYEVYWTCGADYLIGCVVEAPLKRIGAKWGWGAVEQSADDELQDLAREIALAVRELYRYHRASQPGAIEGPGPKPAFVDFHPRLAELWE